MQLQLKILQVHSVTVQMLAHNLQQLLVITPMQMLLQLLWVRMQTLKNKILSLLVTTLTVLGPMLLLLVKTL